MKMINLTEEEHLLFLHKKYSKREFLNVCEIGKNSFGKEFALRIYKMIFYFGLDVVGEYEKYYENEYESLLDYMFWRLCLPKEIIDDHKEMIEGSCFISLFKNHSFYLYEDNIFSDLIYEIFNALGESYEN